MNRKGGTRMMKAIGRETEQENAAEQRETAAQPEESPARDKTAWTEKLARNLALAGMLVLIVTAVRNDCLPSGQTVLSAVQSLIDTGWDDSVGKISFVSNLLPDAVSVFFETPLSEEWTAPCFGTAVHAWSREEPYLGYEATDSRVFAMADGQVMSVAHGPDEERILRVRQENGLEVMYYNLSALNVREGDQVKKDQCIAASLPQGVAVEIRRAGRPIDPTEYIKPRTGDSP